MADLSPRERRQQRTRNAILSTAVELVREDGVHKLSLREIARRIDYSPAGLYEYFGSKEEIIEAICYEGNLRMSRHLANVDKDLPFKEYIIALGHAYVKYAVEDPDYFMLMFSRNFAEQQQVSKEEFETYEPDATDSFSFPYYAVKDAMAKGIIHTNGTAKETAFGIWSIAHGMAVLRITSLANYEIDFQSVEQNTMEIFLRGLMKKIE